MRSPFLLPVVAALLLSGCGQGAGARQPPTGEGDGQDQAGGPGDAPADPAGDQPAHAGGDEPADEAGDEAGGQPVDEPADEPEPTACGWIKAPHGGIEATGRDEGDVIANVQYVDQCDEPMEQYDFNGEYHVLYMTAAW